MSEPYPVRVEAQLEPRLSRGLWLVKWLLLVPHYVVLAFLWMAFVVLSVVAWFAVLFTGRYPQSIFEFNVGVLRWSWRVSCYGYGALSTDRYPPFTLDDVPDYPAHFDVVRPERLSRGLVLVKSWLLAVPHYLVLAFLGGGGLYVATSAAGDGRSWTWGSGLIGLLVLFAGVVLLVRGSYPRGIFDLVIGMDRWVLRVVAYAALMTDEYPPFRLDTGGGEPGSPVVPLGTPPEPGAEGRSPNGTARGASAPSAGRILGLVVGSLAILIGVGAGLSAAALALVDTSMRDGEGYLMSEPVRYDTASWAISTQDVRLHADGAGESLPGALLGDLKLTAEAPDGAEVFVGIARTEDVEEFLDGVGHAVLIDMDGTSTDPEPVYREVGGAGPRALPGDADIWAAQVSGPDVQTLQWDIDRGDWTVVLMNADGGPGVAADVAAGATVPALGWGIVVLLVLSGAGLVSGSLLVWLALRTTRPAARVEDRPLAGAR